MTKTTRYSDGKNYRYECNKNKKNQTYEISGTQVIIF